MAGEERRSWTLLTSHGHVLVEVARNPQARVRDISAAIGITERATQSIIADLEEAGYVERIRVGRRTHYVLHTDNPFRHSAQDGLRVGPFLELLTGAAPSLPAADGVLPAPVPEQELVAAAMEAAEPELPTEIPSVPGATTFPTTAPATELTPIPPEPNI